MTFDELRLARIEEQGSLAAGGRASATLVASDLTPAYVRFNSEYST